MVILDEDLKWRQFDPSILGDTPWKASETVLDVMEFVAKEGIGIATSAVVAIAAAAQLGITAGAAAPIVAGEIAAANIAARAATASGLTAASDMY